MSISLFVIPAVLFAIVYFPVVTKLSRSLASPYAKADIRKRLFAATVDGLLVITGWFFYRSSESALIALAGAAYLLLRDAWAGRSAGKFLVGLVVVSLETGRPCTVGGSIRRNILLVVPGVNVVAVFLEVVTIVRDAQGQRLGDRWALTQVVEGLGIKDFAAAFQRWWQSFIVELPALKRPERETSP
jgi:hypothetical protein